MPETLACGNHELIRMLLVNRWHPEHNPGIRDIAGALTATRDFVGRLPDAADAWLLRGLALFLAGETEAAAGQLARGISLLPPAAAAEFDPGFLPPLEDPLLSTTINERLVSHQARVVYANLYYPGWRRSIGRLPEITPGEFVVRIGIPDAVEYRWRSRDLDADATNPVPLWLMLGNEVARTVFQRDFGQSDWVLLEQNVGPVLAQLGATPELDDDARKRRIDLYHAFARLRAPDGSTDVLATIGIPLSTSVADPSGAALAPVLGSFVLGPGRSVVSSRIENIDRVSDDRMRGIDSFLVWTQPHILALGAVATAIVRQEAISTRWISVYEKEVETLPSAGLAVSDPVLCHAVYFGVGETPGGVVRGDFTIVPRAAPIVDRGEPIPVYFEAYGLALDADGVLAYGLTVELRRQERGGLLRGLVGSRSTAVSVGLEVPIAESTDEQHIELDASAAAPGGYHLVVRITDRGSGEVVEGGTLVILR